MSRPSSVWQLTCFAEVRSLLRVVRVWSRLEYSNAVVWACTHYDRQLDIGSVVADTARVKAKRSRTI
jgi:hypothetical protein